jgi:ankyrin repeat protein
MEELPLELIYSITSFLTYQDFLRLRNISNLMQLRLFKKPSLHHQPFLRSLKYLEAKGRSFENADGLTVPFSIQPSGNFHLEIESLESHKLFREIIRQIPHWINLLENSLKSDSVVILLGAVIVLKDQLELAYLMELFSKLVALSRDVLSKLDLDNLLTKSARKGFVQAFDALTPLRSDFFQKDILVQAIHSGRLEFAEYLIDAYGIDPMMEDGSFICQIVSLGNEDEVIHLMRNFAQILPGFRDNFLLRHSCSFGFHRLAHYLLLDRIEEVDPGVENNSAIRKACQKGFVDIVADLLLHPRCDPSIEDNKPIKLASMNGYTEIVRMLLHHPRVNPNPNPSPNRGSFSESPLTLAARWGHLDCLKVLLADRRVDCLSDNGAALTKSALNGHTAVVQYLLSFQKIADATSTLREARKWAHRMGRYDIIQMLIPLTESINQEQ